MWFTCWHYLIPSWAFKLHATHRDVRMWTTTPFLAPASYGPIQQEHPVANISNKVLNDELAGVWEGGIRSQGYAYIPLKGEIRGYQECRNQMVVFRKKLISVVQKGGNLGALHLGPCWLLILAVRTGAPSGANSRHFAINWWIMNRQ